MDPDNFKTADHDKKVKTAFNPIRTEYLKNNVLFDLI